MWWKWELHAGDMNVHIGNDGDMNILCDFICIALMAEGEYNEWLDKLEFILNLHELWFALGIYINIWNKRIQKRINEMSTIGDKSREMVGTMSRTF